MRQLESFLQELATVGAIAFPMAAVAAWGLAVRRRRRMPERQAWSRSVLDIGLLLAALPVIMVTVIVTPASGGARVDLDLGTDLAPAFTGDTGVWPVLGKFIILMPLGALLPMRLPTLHAPWRLLAAALGIAAATEVAQLAFASVVTLDSVLLKTIGLLLGAGLTYPWWSERHTGGTAQARMATASA